MKKMWTLFLTAALLLTALTSCRMLEKQDPFKEILEENPEMELPKSEVMEVDPEDIPQQQLPEVESGDPGVELIEMDEGQLAIKHKIFEYKNHNLVVMRVENHSDRDLTLTVKGTCEDIGGQTMTITKKFEGFAANWQNYILFYPEFAFDHFEYEIEYEPFTGEAYSQHAWTWSYKRIRVRYDNEFWTFGDCSPSVHRSRACCGSLSRKSRYGRAWAISCRRRRCRHMRLRLAR